MLRMVVGFLFDPTFERVVLIQKAKPDWQKDRFNGVGGKMESGETALMAMRREFKEEAGLDVRGWDQFLRLLGKTQDGTRDWELNVFWAKGPVDEAHTTEEEPIFVASVADVVRADMKTLGNIPWLVAMAKAVATGCEGCVFFEAREMERRS